MRILIIGAVAAGTSAAAKARRNSEECEIVVYEKEKYISYSSCGMPYYIGKRITDFEELVPRDPEYFKTRYNVDILIGHEVLSIDPKLKQLEVKNLETGEVFTDNFDKLIISTGTKAILPPIDGINNSNVFLLRNVKDMLKITDFIKDKKPMNAAIIGTGFIGLELCENLSALGLKVSMIEKMSQVASGLDSDMAINVQKYIEHKNIQVYLNAKVDGITDQIIKLEDGKEIPADIVIVAAGVRPDVDLAKKAGLEIGKTGAIVVNTKMETNIKDIYACGDCIEQFNLITGKPTFRPLGSTANKTGRIAGDNVTGGTLRFRGILGTSIFKVFDLAVAQTGLSEKEALELGYTILISHNIKPSKPAYMGGKDMVIKAVADKITGRLLGVQITGEDGVDKRIDVFATAITFGSKAEDLSHLDLAYAPPFSTTKDPVIYTGMILDNEINRGRMLITAKKMEELIASGEKLQIIDTRIPKQYAKSSIEGAVNIPLEKLREESRLLDKNITTVVYCNKGITGNAAQNILLNKGFTKVYNISGGKKAFSKWMEASK